MQRRRTTRALGMAGAAALIAGNALTIALQLPVGTAGAAATLCGTSGTPSVIALADPNFYIDSGVTPKLDSTYIGYTVRAGASSETGLRLALSDFSGGVVSLAAGQLGATSLPSIPAASTASAYFLLRATGPTLTPQTHTVTLYRGATAVCARTFTYTTVSETIKALANKVTSVNAAAASAPAAIGDAVVVTVTGFTGQLGAGPGYDPGVLSYAPTALSGFPASSWRLERTEMTVSPDGNAAAATYIDRLYLSGASGPDRPYTAKYTFRAVAPAATTATVQPVQYIASGTQVKHTDLGGSATGLLPVVSNEAALAIAKSATPTSFTPSGGTARGGTVDYTVTVANSGIVTGSLDSIVDTLPAGTSFVVGSATVAGRAATPTAADGTLTFYGPLNVAAGSTLRITYQLTIPATAGSYANSVVGMFATSQIDGSRDVTASDPATATVTVFPATAAVNAVNDSTSTNANTFVDIAVTANDIGSGLTVAIVTAPANGTAVVSGTTVRYTPTTGFGGTDTFVYSITDGYTSDTATVSVSVPQARNDLYANAPSTSQTPATLTVLAANGLLANDFCSAAQCTVAVVGTTPTGLTLASTGAFTYVMPQTNGAITTFTYRLTDANGRTADATVNIYASNFGPDRAITPFNTAVAIPITLNDVCTGTCNPTPTDPPHGTAVKTNDTTITYTPDTGFWGVDTFTYSKGGSGTSAAVTVLVAPPTATFTTTFGTPITKRISDLAYTAGIAATSCSGCTYAAGTAPTKGTVQLDPSTGQFTYTPTADASGNDSFTVTITEPGGLSVTATVNLVIGPDAADDAARVFASTAGTTREVTINVLTNDNCPSTCTITMGTPPSGTLTRISGGTYTYSNATAIGPISWTYSVLSSVAPSTPDTATITVTVEGADDDATTTSPGTPVNIAVRSNDPCVDCTLGTVDPPSVGTAVAQVDGTVTYTPPADFAGIATFTYWVTKGGASTSAVVTVTVRPDAVDDAYGVVPGDTTSYAVLDNDICSTCRITAVGTPSAGTATLGGTGLVVFYTAPASGTGPYTFTYTITDGTGATDTATVTLTVATPPAAVDDAATTVAGTAKALAVTANDTCVVGTTCTVEIAADAAHGTVSLSVDPAADLQYTPFAGFTGIDQFTYLLISSNGLTSTATVTITVTPTAADDRAVAGTGQTITIDIVANDACTGCSIAMVGSPSGGSVDAIDAGGASYTAPATPGTYTFVYRLTETDTSPTSTADATVTVVVSNAAPDLASTPLATPVVIDLTANDTCLGFTPACGVTAVDTPSTGGAAIIDAGATDSSITFTPTADQSGLVSFGYTATNGVVTANGTVTVLVGPAPIERTIETNTTATGSLLTGVTCEGCVVTVVSAPGNGEITIDSNGSYSYVPALDDVGTDATITYRITDPATGLEVDGLLTFTMVTTTPSVAVMKTAGGIDDTDDPANGAGDVGDTITYTYVVQNTGGRVLSAVTLTDDRIAAVAIDCDGDNVIATLAVGASVTCTATDTLSQADVDAGSVTNTASIAATAEGGGAGGITATDEVTVDITAAPAATIVKSAGSIVDTDTPVDGAGDAGDTITYSYVITNTGNVTLTDVTLSDDLIAATDIDCDGDNVIASLAPGDAVTCTATYTLTQTDIDAGSVTNTAGLAATAPRGTTGAVTTSTTAEVSIARSASLTLVKSGELDDTVVAPSGRADEGDTVTYSYVITNVGNVTLTDVTLTDDRIAAVAIDCDGDNVIASLAPGDAVTCTADYAVTQTDIDAGGVDNVATVSGDDPDGTPTVLTTDPVTVPFTRAASLSVAKTAGTPTATTITYSYVITNTGNVTLTDLTLTDDLIAATDIDCDGDGDNVITSLAPGDAVTCTATYTLTQTDIDAGSVTNIATVTATAPDGATTPTDATDTVTATIERTAAATIVKSAGSIVDTDTPVDGAGDAGDTITYSYVITNTGNVTLTDVTLTDDLIAATDIDCDGDNVLTSLAPGDAVTCTATYTLTQTDIDAGSVTNIATVTATAPNGATTPTDATDTVTVDLPAPPDPTTIEATDDLVVVPQGAVVTVLVLSNDLGTGIQVDFVGRPSAGSVSLDGDDVTVTPPLMHLGDITMAYGITDGTRTDTATLTVRITANTEPLIPELFIDTNGNGDRDAGEPGIPHVPMALDLSSRMQMRLDGSGRPARPATIAPVTERVSVWRRITALVPVATFRCDTGDTGVCLVDELPVGTYEVTADFDLAAWGMSITADPDGSGDLVADTTSGDGTDPAVSFGVRGTSTVAGTAFLQRGGGGGYDPGVDTPLGGHIVELEWAGPDGVPGTPDDVVVEVTTAPDGTYSVSGLPGGSYTVRVSSSGLPAGVTAPAPVTVTVAVGASADADLPVPTTTALPATGSDVRRTVPAALALLGLGLLLTAIARRRRDLRSAE